jgi:hypothetical protein
MGTNGLLLQKWPRYGRFVQGKIMSNHKKQTMFATVAVGGNGRSAAKVLFSG